MRDTLLPFLLLLLFGTSEAWAAGVADAQLPPLPGMEEAEPAKPPFPGSAPKGSNPQNAVHLDTMHLVEGIIAGGLGGGAAYERSLGGLVGVEAQAGYVRGRDTAVPSGLHVLSLLAGPRLYLLQTAVNGPSVGVSGGAALAWIELGTQRSFRVWPQIQADVGIKFSLGPGARGFFLEPRVGFKFAFKGPETDGWDMPTYGQGLAAGLRLGLSL